MNFDILFKIFFRIFFTGNLIRAQEYLVKNFGFVDKNFKCHKKYTFKSEKQQLVFT